MKYTFLAFFLTAVTFVLVRLIGIDRALWQDEYISINALANNFLVNPFYFGFTTNLPLYFIFLKIYTFFGIFTNVFYLRFFTVLISLLTAIVSFLFLKKYFGLFTALTFSLFLCFLPIQLHYSQEIRPYALTQLLIVLNIYFTYSYLYFNKYKKAIFLVTLLLCLSHYTGFMFSLIFNILVLFTLFIKKDPKKITLFSFLLILNLVLAFSILYIFSLNNNFISSINASTGKSINLSKVIDFPNNFFKEGLIKIKEVLSFYYFFGLWYYLVDIRVQFIFKKIIMLFLATGFFIESINFFKTRKISLYWFSFILLFILMVSGYFLETIGLYPFGGRHIFPYSVIYYFVLIYPLRLVKRSLKIIFLLVFLAFIPLFIFHQSCVNYIVKKENITISNNESYTYCVNKK